MGIQITSHIQFQSYVDIEKKLDTKSNCKNGGTTIKNTLTFTIWRHQVLCLQIILFFSPHVLGFFLATKFYERLLVAN